MKTKYVKSGWIGPLRPAKTFEQLVKEQGVRPVQWEKAWGAAAKLWDSNEEMEQFLRDLRKRRQKGT